MIIRKGIPVDITYEEWHSNLNEVWKYVDEEIDRRGDTIESIKIDILKYDYDMEIKLKPLKWEKLPRRKEL